MDITPSIRQKISCRTLAVLLLLGTFLCTSVHAIAPVEALALYKNRAVVRVNGDQVMLKVGETSKNGVTLLASGPKGATVRYNDDVYELTLTTRVGTRFKKTLEKNSSFE